MNASAFRHLYDYHFTENRHMWEAHIAPLPWEQVIEDVGYSRGSIRNQVVHLMSVDNTWFDGLRGVGISEPLIPTDFVNAAQIQRRWEQVEAGMRAYLAELRDARLFDKPFPAGEDQDLLVWQVLVQVVTHGTDHRAQILRLLNDLGVKTVSQDYIFYAYEHPVGDG